MGARLLQDSSMNNSFYCRSGELWVAQPAYLHPLPLKIETVPPASEKLSPQTLVHHVAEFILVDVRDLHYRREGLRSATLTS